MSSIINICLFGAPSAEIDGQSVKHFHSQRVAALFFYLTLVENAQTRRTLAALLWDEADAAQASANLSKTLYHLPAAVKPWVEANRTVIGLRLPAAASVDAHRFAALHHCAMTPGLPPERRAGYLQQVIDLYRGELLHGFGGESATGFARWLEDERRRYRQLAVSAHSELLAHHTERKAPLQAIRHATALLTLDKTHEATYRQLIDLFVRLGQPDAAADVYRTCCQALQEAMGAPPSAETMAVAAQAHLL
jgi:DNA-binding SARP family transcriptional activator